MLAVVRPDSWNLPLFLHVLGAMVLVGTLATAAVALLASSGRTAHGSPDSRSGRFSSPACRRTSVPL